MKISGLYFLFFTENKTRHYIQIAFLGDIS